MIELDGAKGEGGGQILRTALSLSMVTGRPFQIINIRDGRDRPGLLRQHLTAVKAACAVCSGKADGAEIGSRSLVFHPGRVRAGEYSFAIGTAGSTTLVLQTLLPALMTADEPSTVTVKGGTHNPAAPSVHFLSSAYAPLIERLGPRLQIELIRHGFYPAGGGIVRAEIEPCRELTPFTLEDRGEILGRRAVASIAALPGEIAKRELAVVERKLGWDAEALMIEQLSDRLGPGNILNIEVESEHITEVFTGFGRLGVSAEAVAEETIAEVRAYLASGVPIWRHLADQLLLPLALAGRGVFRTGPLTSHAETNAEVIERFLQLKVRREPQEGKTTRVEILA
ncbi:MAG: RNA 3'-terminal phosphate cyclase [Phycisphaerales bacterium]|nr:RNA 3'-terminal phosphate cyclase [Phycisphaerales bacterium]